ncbi:MAG: glycosyltransferase [Candidatus Omnitrophica bacterium]|jgi:GT2 family glycosyltransferase|nr:glycosyltransferase [Candidatus Omnitrophota bacterium]MDD5080125.1 glycosyltransferase [Candidatus Omnitrophota bacterium]
MSSKTVGIIIVSAGREDFIRPLLDSIKAQDHPVSRVIVIDNSRDGLSYCQALNKGIAECREEFILCLNDDVILENDFVRLALAGFSIDGRVGMVSGKILRWDKKTIDSTGLFLSVFRTVRERGYGVLDCGQYEKPGMVFGVTGAVAFYRRSMLDGLADDGKVFDEDMSFFYEDLDIAWRGYNAGWTATYVPRAKAYHLRGGTARPAEGIGRKFSRRFLSDHLQFELIKNRYITIIKNERLADFLCFFIFIVFYELLSWVFLLVFNPGVLRLFFERGIPAGLALSKRNRFKYPAKMVK